jgi:hypothetical protein
MIITITWLLKMSIRTYLWNCSLGIFVTNLLGLSKKNKGEKCKANSTKYHFNNEAHSTKSATTQIWFCTLQTSSVGVNFSRYFMTCFIHSFLFGCLYLVLPLWLAHHDKVIKNYNDNKKIKNHVLVIIIFFQW